MVLASAPALCPACQTNRLRLDLTENRWACDPCGADWAVGPTPRWYPLRHHGEQRRLFYSPARICVCGAGRRSGKTERAKRRGVWAAGANTRFPDYRVAFMAPTRDHARDIYWEDLKLLVPPSWIAKISESRLTIYLVNGALIQVIGMDRPRRVEGSPLDFAFCDEMGDQKPDAWEKHIAPALETPGRLGRAWLYGVTRPGGSFRQLSKQAKDPSVVDMEWFHWKSDEILSPEQIERARARMDPRTYAQEFDAEFVYFEGRVYYTWETARNARYRLKYDPRQDLLLTFDFGTRPGVANILQEQSKDFYHRELGWRIGPEVADDFTSCLGEVHLDRDSRTTHVIKALVPKIQQHKGDVRCYGDVSGGHGHSSQPAAGSDWDIIRGMLREVFGDRVTCHPGHDDKHNPSVVARTNATCARMQDTDGLVRYLVDPVLAPETVLDYEEVCWKKGVREIEKNPEVPRTHHSDGVDYYIERKHPIGGGDFWLDDPLSDYDFSPWE